MQTRFREPQRASAERQTRRNDRGRRVLPSGRRRKGLGGTWKAWLSEFRSSPSTRFTHSTVPYRLLDGSLIANDWNALTSGTIAHPINIFEDGTPVPPSVVHEVWTGTTPSGTYSGNSCSNWTNDTMSGSTADVGLTNQVGTGWTDIYRQFCNRTTLHVYCFEQ